MERVALPAPSLALTTSSPPNWMRLTSAASSSPPFSTIFLPSAVCERMGTIVTPEWPPTTGTTVSAGRVPARVERKAEERTTSRVVTPKRLRERAQLQYEAVTGSEGRTNRLGS